MEKNQECLNNKDPPSSQICVDWMNCTGGKPKQKPQGELNTFVRLTLSYLFKHNNKRPTLPSPYPQLLTPSTWKDW